MGKDDFWGFLQARLLVAVLGFVLIFVIGVPLLLVSSQWGFTFISWGGGILLTYLVVDVLLLQQDRANWKAVEEKVRSVIRSELQGIRIDVTLFTGAQDVVVSFPAEATREEEEHLLASEQLREARRLVADIAALKQRVNPLFFQAGSLFESRADKLASLQNRYWSRLLEPELMGYLIDLEGKLRLVGTCLAMYNKYSEAPGPTDEALKPLRMFEIDSSKEALYQSLQQLLALVVDGIDRGIVPTE
ncbi:MAG: hypothetical protein ABR867_03985 [Nitrososphaerales archaeon]